jgi:hypothetical protein
MTDSLRLELILSQRVRALNGRVIGRLEEVIAETEGDTCYVNEYLIGAYGWVERLAAWPVARELFRLLRLARRNCGFRVHWNQLDVNDPSNLRLRCKISELERADLS